MTIDVPESKLLITFDSEETAEDFIEFAMQLPAFRGPVKSGKLSIKLVINPAGNDE